MSLSRRRYLPDLNCLIALADPDHPHYGTAKQWFVQDGSKGWGVCPLTEAGFVRVTTNPSYGRRARTVSQATAILAGFTRSPGYFYWPIERPWAVLTAPFVDRIFGHQQVTDAYLLGLAVQQRGVLITFDRGLKYLAGVEYDKHVLLLE
ncbi:MAG TPA: TA system VapC family ribonuclease toxin [Acidobacteriaceae bacterium]|nr:TA system VapC family ribonuclease toxin [Acidobacteriaceae bacterium]